MAELLSKRLSRELFLAAMGVEAEPLGDWVLDRITTIADEEDVRSGQVLWREGEPLDSFYFMRNGRVRATRDGAPPWTFEGRWFFGAFEGTMDRPARRTMVALTDFQALRVERRSWLDLLEDSFALARLAILRTAGVLAALDEQLGQEELPPRLDTSSAPIDDGPLGIIERLALLMELGMARGAGVQALADLAAVTQEITLARGAALLQSDEDAEFLFLVAEGEVETTRATGVTRRYVAGQILGRAAALSPQGRAWDGRARAASRLLAIPVEAWFDLMEEHFDLVQSSLAEIGQQREALLDRLGAKAGPEGLVFR